MEENEEIKEDLQGDLVNTIKELKDTTVSRDKYEEDVSQLQSERKRLLDIIKNGGDVDEEEQSIDSLKEQLMSGKLNNLDYVKNSLLLRQKVLEEQEIDIFEAQGHTVDRQIVNGEKVATFLQGCVDKAEGNSQVFTALLNSNLNDPMGIKNRKGV